jgi:hypothetical protein
MAIKDTMIINKATYNNAYIRIERIEHFKEKSLIIVEFAVYPDQESTTDGTKPVKTERVYYNIEKDREGNITKDTYTPAWESLANFLSDAYSKNKTQAHPNGIDC